MHIRRTDFIPACKHDCLPVSLYATHLEQVIQGLREAGVTKQLPVLVGTDDTYEE
jgi:hypothetical protein